MSCRRRFQTRALLFFVCSESRMITPALTIFAAALAGKKFPRVAGFRVQNHDVVTSRQ
jgi:hypothetical protein